MRRWALAAIMAFAASAAWGGKGIAAPVAVVERMIRAAHNNDLGGILMTADLAALSEGHSGLDLRRLVAILRKVDLQKTTLKGRTVMGPQPRARERVTLQGRYNWQFDLELRRNVHAEKDGRRVLLPPHYVVVSVHN